MRKKFSWMKDSASADCALSLNRLPLRIKPIVENMHSTSMDDALLVRITAANCFKWSICCAFFQNISGSLSVSSSAFTWRCALISPWITSYVDTSKQCFISNRWRASTCNLPLLHPERRVPYPKAEDVPTGVRYYIQCYHLLTICCWWRLCLQFTFELAVSMTMTSLSCWL